VLVLIPQYEQDRLEFQKITLLAFGYFEQ